MHHRSHPCIPSRDASPVSGDLAAIRHENARVLRSLEASPGLARADRAAALGMGEFALVLVLRRLEQAGLIEAD